MGDFLVLIGTIDHENLFHKYLLLEMFFWVLLMKSRKESQKKMSPIQ